MPKLSIIIPTLNEGTTIGWLLSALSKQTFRDFEVVVVDCNSKDNTKEIVSGFANKLPALKLLTEKRRGVGLARNVGAANSSGKYILFLDADVLMTNEFLQNVTNEFDGRFLDVATCYITPLSNKLIDYALHEATNITMNAVQYFSPAAPGWCILVTRRLHNRIGGFNKKLRLAEDHEYVSRASRFGKFRVLRGSKIKVSVRRLDEEGRPRLVAKYIFVGIYRAIVGEVTKPIFCYELGKHGNLAIKPKLIELKNGQLQFNLKFLKEFEKTLKTFGLK